MSKHDLTDSIIMTGPTLHDWVWSLVSMFIVLALLSLAIYYSIKLKPFQQVADSSDQTNPRQGLRQLTLGLPKLIDVPVQAWLTNLTGVPYTGQKPLLKVVPIYYLFVGLILAVGGGIASISIISYNPLLCPLLPLTELLTLGGAWQLSTVVNHYAGGHSKVVNNQKVDRILAQLLSIFCLTTPTEIFSEYHSLGHHDFKKLSTLEDPDMLTMVKWKFLPGMPKEYYWSLLRQLIISPKWHLSVLQGRLRSNILDNEVSILRRLGAILFCFTLLVSVTVTDSWLGFIIGWLLPLTVGFQIAFLLELVTKHLWGLAQKPDMPEKLYYESKSFGRYLGKQPPFGENFTSWLVWVLGMIGDCILRIVVIPADLVVHDYHHARPMSSKWAMAIWQRQEEIERGCPGRAEIYQGIWGFWQAVDKVFETLSTATPTSEFQMDNGYLATTGRD